MMVIVWTPVVGLAFLLTAWWDRPRRITGRVFRFGARLLVTVNPYWRVRVIGALPRRSAHPLVVVSNHESLADVLLIGTLSWDMRWLSKASIFRVPFLGLMMRMAGDVAVRREDAGSRAESYRALTRWIERGASVMIFPEGTRSRTRSMLPFRNGAFRLAIETGCPILPLAVSGTRQAIQKGSMRFGHADVSVRVLEAVPTAGLSLEDVGGLRDRVRDAIDEARGAPAEAEAEETGP